MVGLVWLALRLPSARVTAPAPWALITGAAAIAYASVYPHFLIDRPMSAYLYAAPLGLVPCPSLSIAIGFALLGSGYGARTWSLALAGLGLFYGAFGALRLGVWLDVGLLAASACLIARATAAGRPGCSPTRRTSRRARSRAAYG